MKPPKDQHPSPSEQASWTRRDFLKGAAVTVSGASLIGGKLADAARPNPEENGTSRVGLQLILVETRQKAEEIRKRLEAGESFERLAQKYSIDPSGPSGGYLGRLKISGLRPQIREALQGVHPGQLTRVFETPSGYMIMKLLSKAASLAIESAQRNQQLAARAMAQVQLVTSVSGSDGVLTFFKRVPKPPNWGQDLQAICQTYRQSYTLGLQASKNYLKEAKARKEAHPDLTGIMGGYEALAQFESFQGKMQEAIKAFQEEYQMAVATHAYAGQHELEEKLGIAYMCQGDIENQAKTVHYERSIFPIRPEARYKLGANVQQAIQHFQKFLRQEPADIEVEWLLNVAYMKLGKYPEGVPPQHLIPPGAFKSKEDIGRFVNVAPALGLDIVEMSGGLIVDDFDNDGFLDIVTSSYNPCTPMRYFHNNGDGTFSDWSDKSGLAKQLGGLNLMPADYNNDGWLDILVLRGAWQPPMRNSLLRNNGDGTFTDVTEKSGLAVPATSTQTAAWADFDNDGHLDLFVGNEMAPSQLFRNKGDGTFEDVGPAAGIDRSRFTKGVVAGDYDNDRYPDFYVSNLDGENFLYHNNGDGSFTDVAKKLHVELPLLSFPVWFFDYNNDGWLDLFVSSHYQSVVEVAAGYLDLPLKGEGAKLYKNTGKGTFQDVSEQAGLNRSFMPMGSNFGDIDNDGFLDIYLGTGAPSYGAVVPNVFFRNHDGEYFADITASSGTGSLQKGHGVAFADINNDGLVELLIHMGGATPGDKASMLVFRNPGNDNHWLTVHLVGVKSNRAAIGARIKVTVESEDHSRRSVHRVVGSGGSFGASPLRQHIGLGKAKRIESLEIWWPTSDTRQIFRNVDRDQFIEVKEFAKKFTVPRRNTFPLPADDEKPS